MNAAHPGQMALEFLRILRIVEIRRPIRSQRRHIGDVDAGEQQALAVRLKRRLKPELTVIKTDTARGSDRVRPCEAGAKFSDQARGEGDRITEDRRARMTLDASVLTVGPFARKGFIDSG